MSKIAKKMEPKTKICKEFNCAESAQVNGFCRLHFLKLVKPGARKTDEEDEVKRPRRNPTLDRDALRAPEHGGLESDEPLADRVEKMGELDVNITGFADLEALGAPPGQPVNPKKTGT